MKIPTNRNLYCVLKEKPNFELREIIQQFNNSITSLVLLITN